MKAEISKRDALYTKILDLRVSSRFFSQTQSSRGNHAKCCLMLVERARKILHRFCDSEELEVDAL